ncbi:MerR family transcriptional regulator [Anaerosporobacter sp.]|uniref:MerR family transcriptional regulator n=1 Tax=Anaerosporobacter sp. TaxID=1872529 RepID=UPI00286ECBC3|nr:MerR family transcriptional regulator [Anaerosporobacter sp.]
MGTYSIREVCQKFNITASTLRYYEDLGLLPLVERTPNGQRIYTDCHISRLVGIQCFKQTGLPLAQIQNFFLYEENISEYIDEILLLVTEHEQDIIRQMQEMESNLAHIHQKVSYYRGIKDAIKLNKEWPCWNDYKNVK